MLIAKIMGLTEVDCGQQGGMVSNVSETECRKQALENAVSNDELVWHCNFEDSQGNPSFCDVMQEQVFRLVQFESNM